MSKIEPKHGVPEDFLKPYNPAEEECAMYKLWEESGYFNPDNLPPLHKDSAEQNSGRTEPFTIMLPPPNVTGILHMGSAMMLAVEDVLVRHARMSGKKALWLPGTDSAAIATQARVEKDIQKKEGKSRYDLGRGELLKRIDAFVEENKSTILGQMRAMGASLDWSRYAYTMDAPRYSAVMEAFVRMYDAGLIYRGNRIVNWDPGLQTTVSDDEIEYVERKDPFYYFQYGPFVIGTVRPETKFGDKYVVINPKDERYKAYKHEQNIDLEWINGAITATVLHDPEHDMEFGSGAMTITPSHDSHDFALAQKFNLDYEQVIDDRGILLPIAGEFAGQHIKKARQAVVEKLKAKGLVVKIDEDYVHNVATNSRGGGVIEPQIKLQWFIAVNKEFAIPHSEIPGIKSGDKTTLKKIMQTAVKSGEIKILPERFEHTYFHWIDNLRDWCISRQIWFGHRIPIWYHEPKCIPKPGREKDVEKCKLVVASPEKPTCEFCDAQYKQDEDVLDTWFSSSLWTFSTLGWPKETPDLKTFHPTSVIESGYDILFFWIARMILMSGFHLGQVPFKTVYLHGLVRDKEGKKLSKSLGNNIDPMEMGQKYGIDAVRMSLIVGTAPGADSKMSEDKIRANKHFANKLWNITRFVLENTVSSNGAVVPYMIPLRDVTLVANDTARLAELNSAVADISKDIANLNLHLAAEKLYHYAWHTFADVVIEESKPILNGADMTAKASRQWFLYHALITMLKLLHPFMPFVTEAIWQKLPHKDTDILMVAQWPDRS